MARTKPTVRKSRPYCPERHKRYQAAKEADRKRRRDQRLQDIADIKAFKAIPPTLVSEEQYDKLKTIMQICCIGNNFNILKSGNNYIQVSNTRHGSINWCNMEVIVKQILKEEFEKAKEHGLVVSRRNKSDVKVVMELIPSMIGEIYTKQSFYQSIIPTVTQLIQCKINIAKTRLVLSTKQQFLSRFNL